MNTYNLTSGFTPEISLPATHTPSASKTFKQAKPRAAKGSHAKTQSAPIDFVDAKHNISEALVSAGFDTILEAELAVRGQIGEEEMMGLFVVWFSRNDYKTRGVLRAIAPDRFRFLDKRECPTEENYLARFGDDVGAALTSKGAREVWEKEKEDFLKPGISMAFEKALFPQVLRALQGRPGVYITQQNYWHVFRREEYLRDLNCAYLDLDIRGKEVGVEDEDGKVTKTLVPTKYAFAMENEPFIVAEIHQRCRDLGIRLPHQIVRSGRGYYCKWHLNRIGFKKRNLKKYKDIQSVMRFLENAFADFGADAVTDAARILRPIGSINPKSGTSGTAVRLIDYQAGPAINFQEIGDLIAPGIYTAEAIEPPPQPIKKPRSPAQIAAYNEFLAVRRGEIRVKNKHLNDDETNKIKGKKKAIEIDQRPDLSQHQGESFFRPTCEDDILARGLWKARLVDLPTLVEHRKKNKISMRGCRSKALFVYALGLIWTNKANYLDVVAKTEQFFQTFNKGDRTGFDVPSVANELTKTLRKLRGWPANLVNNPEGPLERPSNAKIIKWLGIKLEEGRLMKTLVPEKVQTERAKVRRKVANAPKSEAKLLAKCGRFQNIQEMISNGFCWADIAAARGETKDAVISFYKRWTETLVKHAEAAPEVAVPVQTAMEAVAGVIEQAKVAAETAEKIRNCAPPKAAASAGPLAAPAEAESAKSINVPKQTSRLKLKFSNGSPMIFPGLLLFEFETPLRAKEIILQDVYRTTTGEFLIDQTLLHLDEDGVWEIVKDPRQTELYWCQTLAEAMALLEPGHAALLQEMYACPF